MEISKLKNGSAEPAPLVAATMLSLRHLFENDPIAFFDLVSICRDGSYRLFARAELTRLSLLQPDGKPHDSVRNVVLSASEGDGLKMQLVNPIAS